MKRLLVALLALTWATPVVAQPRPPLPVAIIAVEAPGARGLGERVNRLIATLEAEGLLAPRQPLLPAKRVQACGRNVGLESCVRGKLRRRSTLKPPVHVAALVHAGRDGRSRVTCIGPGPNRPWVPAPTAWIDLDRAIDGDAAERSKFIDCLNAAAAERGF